MNKHYCRTCATTENVQGYKWQGGTVYLCDDCRRDFWQDIVSDVPENVKTCKCMQEQQRDARCESGARERYV
jgi:hypothetical protein